LWIETGVYSKYIGKSAMHIFVRKDLMIVKVQSITKHKKTPPEGGVDEWNRNKLT